jgi:hypothetical protein
MSIAELIYPSGGVQKRLPSFDFTASSALWKAAELTPVVRAR